MRYTLRTLRSRRRDTALHIDRIGTEIVCLNEWEHAARAIRLRTCFKTEETLAAFLHQNYRAAAKSAKVSGSKAHDHGFGDCYGRTKRYFRRRARWLMDPRGS